jgi:hypothetical protein
MPDEIEDDVQWGTGSSDAAQARVSAVSRRHALPSSARLRAFRLTIPPLSAMKIGHRHFLPVWDEAEEQVLASVVRKMNARTEDRKFFRLQEWRSHVKGRLLTCVHPEVAPEWEELWDIMRRAMQANKRSPPLDPAGNALVPNLRTRPE